MLETLSISDDKNFSNLHAILNKAHNFLEKRNMNGEGASNSIKRSGTNILRNKRYLTTEHMHPLSFKRMVKQIGCKKFYSESDVIVATTHPKVFTPSSEKNMRYLVNHSKATTFSHEYSKLFK